MVQRDHYRENTICKGPVVGGNMSKQLQETDMAMVQRAKGMSSERWAEADHTESSRSCLKPDLRAEVTI